MVLLNTTNNDSKFAEVALVLRYLDENKNEMITTISNHVYSWIPKYVFYLGNNVLIPGLSIDEKPQDKQGLMVADGIFRSVLNGNDSVARHLMSIYNEHSSNKTSIVENWLNSIVLPQVWPVNHSQYSIIKLIDNLHVWKPSSKVKLNISQNENKLIILVNTYKTERLTKHAFLQTQLKNLTGTPLILSQDYRSNSKSLNADTKYFVQIRNGDNQNLRYFRHDLDESSGNLTRSLFILPNNIVDRPLQFRIGIMANSPGERLITLNNANIIYPASH